LVRDGVVEAVPFDPASKTGFQLAERFFNIWYLMRSTRRARRRLIWLVEFLKMFYAQEELRSHALAHLRSEDKLLPELRLRFAEYSFALAEAIEERSVRRALETSGLYALIEDRTLRERLTELVDLEGDDLRLRPRAEHKERFEKLRETVFSAKPDVDNWSAEKFWRALAGSVQTLDMKEKLATRVDGATADTLAAMWSDFEKEAPFFGELLGSQKAAEAIRSAFSMGWMMAPADVEGARISAVQLEEPVLVAFALACSIELVENPKQILEELETKIEETDSPSVDLLWAKNIAEINPQNQRIRAILITYKADEIHSPLLLLDLGLIWILDGNPDEAKQYIARAQDLGFGDVPGPWLITLAYKWFMIAEKFKAKHAYENEHLYENAIVAARKRIERSTEDQNVWRLLGIILYLQSRYQESEQALRRTVEISPTDRYGWHYLACSLFKQNCYREAEEAHRRTLEIESDNGDAWFELGSTLEAQGRTHEAEQAYRRSVEIAPENAHGWLYLAKCLFVERNLKDAEQAFLKTVDISPEGGIYYAVGRIVLALISTLEGRWSKAFEHTERFITEVPPAFLEECWELIILLFQQVLSAGKAAEAADLLDRLGLSDRWLPILGALETAARGSRDHLKLLAPEVRQPAEEILEQLGWEEESR
jgi:tetratricopeptide (TPR) repeat protein